MRIVVRLLRADGGLVGSDIVEAVGKEDGWLWSPGPVVCHVEADGPIATISMHLPYVNAEIRQPFVGEAFVGGPDVIVCFGSARLLKLGEPPAQRLPTITVRQPVAVAVQPAGWGR